jgi:type II secretory pathway pseudopilin PulG
MDLETRNKIITIVLGVVIIFLGYYLYRSLVDPYQEVLEQQEMTERVRHRMSLVRDALIQYRNINGEFPPTDGGLDTLISFLKTNPRMVEQGNSLFEERPPSVYNPDSLKFSPRSPHNEFQYTLNDTLRPQIYLLEDPDSDAQIGDLERTTMLNAPNWN